MRNIEIDLSEKTAKIDASQNGIIVIDQGKVDFYPMPYTGFGEFHAKWHQKKCKDVDETITHKRR